MSFAGNLAGNSNPSPNSSLFGYLGPENDVPHRSSSGASLSSGGKEYANDSFSYEHALPRSLLHSPPEYNNSSFHLSFGSKKDLEQVSTRLTNLVDRPSPSKSAETDSALLSKFLSRARKSNIKVQIPDDVLNNPSPSVPVSSEKICQVFDENGVSESTSLSGVAEPHSFASDKRVQSDKYNVHAFPFIPVIHPVSAISRVLKVTKLPSGTDPASFFNLCGKYGDIMKIQYDGIYQDGIGFVAFYDRRAAVSAFEAITTLGIKFGRPAAEYVLSQGSADGPVLREALYMSNWSTLRLTFKNPVPLSVWAQTFEMLAKFGEVEPWNNTQDTDSQTCIYSFSDVRSAVTAFQALTSTGFIDGWHLSVGFYNEHTGLEQTMSPSIMSSFYQTVTLQETAHMAPDSYSTQQISPRSFSFSPHGGEYPALKSTLLTDFNAENLEDNLKNGFLDMGHGYSTSFPDSKGHFISRDSLTGGHGASRTGFMSRDLDVVTKANVSKNNVVDLRRIAKGLDTRTTLMLRNIPNKVDQQMLKEYVDVTNKSTYDFLYLRIDFANKCNVGYAFVSFISPEHIITFAKARAGTKWNRFNSEKICDISYANIYGKECLIEKFRNSSVMDQNLAYRPLLFHSDGECVGLPQEFPPPNNMNRKMRSIANIERIGLFSPQSKMADSSTGLSQRTGGGSVASRFGAVRHGNAHSDGF